MGGRLHRRVVGAAALVASLFLLAHVLPARVTLPVAAVTEEGRGVLTNLTVELRPGMGRMLSEIDPPLEVSTQRSLGAAVEAARRLANVSLADRDVTFTFVTNARSVAGPSAGLPSTVGLVALVEGRTPRSGVVLTGAVDGDGTLEPVGGIVPKLEAIAGRGWTLVVPAGQGALHAPLPAIYRVPDVGPIDLSGALPRAGVARPGATLVADGLSSLDLAGYARKRHGVELREARDLPDAASILLAGEPRPPRPPAGDATEVLRSVAMDEVVRAKGALEAAGRLNGTEGVRRRLARADDLLAEGFLYPAASEAFRAAIDAKALLLRSELGNLTDGERRRIVLDRVAAVRREALALEQRLGTAPPPRLRMELAVFAQQRVMWSGYFLSLIVDGLGESAEVPTDELFAFYLLAAEEWAHGAALFLRHAEAIEPEGPQREAAEMCAERLERARTSVLAAEGRAVQDLMGADRFLLAAQLESQKGWWQAACFDAATAESTAEALSERSGDDTERARAAVDPSFAPASLSGRINQEYALLSLRELGNGTSALDAVLFARRARECDELARALDGSPPAPSPPPAPASHALPGRALAVAAVDAAFLLLGLALWAAGPRRAPRGGEGSG